MSEVVYTIMIKARQQVGGFVHGKVVSTIRSFKDMGWKGIGKKVLLSGTPFALSHVPVVGPTLSKIADPVAQKALNWLELSKLRNDIEKERSTAKRVELASRILAASDIENIRISYNALARYMKKECTPELSNCEDVSNAAEVIAASELCVKNLREWLALIEMFERDVSSELERIDVQLKRRRELLTGSLEQFFKTHKDCQISSKCFLELAKDPRWLHQGIELVPLRRNSASR